MMTNKRGSEDISGVASLSAPSESSTPKRSKLDFLAMIAEMSEQAEGVKAASVVPTGTVEQDMTQAARSDSPPPLPAKKPASPKNEAPKSSFAAWKLAKGRKNASKGANRKDIRKEVIRSGDAFVMDTPAPVAAPKVTTAALPMMAIKESSVMDNPLVALAAAAAPLPVPNRQVEDMEVQMPVASAESLPPKKAFKNKDKKTTTSLKKDKEAMPPKKALGKKKGDAGKSSASKKSKSKKGDQSGAKAATFPEKIMELLQGGLAPHAIYWLPEGEAIAVDPDSFKDSPVISKQFRGNKLSSFVRSLNRWGFRRIFYHSLPDKTLAFYHRLFQKQAPALVKEMKMDGGEKEPELPQGAMATAPLLTADGKLAPLLEAPAKKPESPISALPSAPVAAHAPLPVLAETVAASPAEVVQAAIKAASMPPPPAPALPAEDVVSAAVLPSAVASQSALERSALELAEGQHALQLQQAMAAEQERSDLALQSLQAQQLVLQSLADQQNVQQAEELLMQSMLAEQQRSELALQQRQAEQALLQQMVAEQETAALAAALGGTGVDSLSAEALLRERLLVQQLAANPTPASAGSSDVLALLQQQLQGGQLQQPREPSYMEQLLLLEQQQQQQRQQEAALLAARGFRF